MDKIFLSDIILNGHHALSSQDMTGRVNYHNGKGSQLCSLGTLSKWKKCSMYGITGTLLQWTMLHERLHWYFITMDNAPWKTSLGFYYNGQCSMKDFTGILLWWTMLHEWLHWDFIVMDNAQWMTSLGFYYIGKWSMKDFTGILLQWTMLHESSLWLHCNGECFIYELHYNGQCSMYDLIGILL